MSNLENANFEYDSLPYPSMTFPQTHPNHLAAIGKFYNLEAAAPEKCRVLELGCGDGTNLNWLAYNLPESKFVGIDLSKNHIAEAKNTVAELNLENIEFFHQDVLEIEKTTFGKFDYIIAHGLFSWVPDFVREKILDLYNELLNPNGIGYISYNVFPGCHRRKIMGDAMRFHSRKFTNPSEKIRQTIPFVKFLTENAAESQLYRDILKYEFEGMIDRGESNIFHDDLSSENQPFYFSEFIELAENKNLQYLSDTERFTSQPQKLPAQVLEQISVLSENVVEYEQYVDFFLSCRFRQTLLCKKNNDLDRDYRPEKIKQFYISSNLHPTSENVDISGQTSETFTSPNGSNVETNHPLTKTALFYLHNFGIHRISFDKLVNESCEILQKEGFNMMDRKKEADIMASVFFQIHSPNSVRFHICESNASKIITEKPKVSEFARLQANRDQNVTTHYGLNLTIDDYIKEFIILLDGSRNLEEITSEMINKFHSDIQDSDTKEFIEETTNRLTQSLNQLAKVGLLES